MIENTNYSIADIIAQAKRAINMNERVRNTAFTPNLNKQPPTFNGNQIADLCKIDRNAFNRRVAKGDLPIGVMQGGRAKTFTLAEARIWAKSYSQSYERRPGQDGVVITVANSKGGVGKSTTTMCLAQALSSKGYKGLVCDFDPQGSLSSLCNYLPDTQVEEAETVLPLCAGVYNFKGPDEKGVLHDEDFEDVENLLYAIRPTYWDGLDVVTCAPTAFAAEFHIPTRAMTEEGFRFYNVIRDGLNEIKKDYDFVLIDCPPAMSYLTIGASWASDAMIIPVPPRGMDFSATAAFWSLFTNIAKKISESGYAKEEGPKEWKFINVLLSMVDSTDERTGFMSRLINETYGSMVVPVEIPKTSVSSTTGSDYKTVYDLSRFQGTAKPAYDRVADLLEQQIRACWRD